MHYVVSNSQFPSFLYTQFRTPERSSLEFVDLDRCTQRRKYDRKPNPAIPCGGLPVAGWQAFLKTWQKPSILLRSSPRKLKTQPPPQFAGFGTNPNWQSCFSVHSNPRLRNPKSTGNCSHALASRSRNRIYRIPSIGMFPRRIELFRFRSGDQGKTRSSLASILFSPPEVTALAANELVKLETDNAETIDTTGQYVNQIIDFNYARRASKQSNTQTR